MTRPSKNTTKQALTFIKAKYEYALSASGKYAG